MYVLTRASSSSSPSSYFANCQAEKRRFNNITTHVLVACTLLTWPYVYTYVHMYIKNILIHSYDQVNAIQTVFVVIAFLFVL